MLEEEQLSAFGIEGAGDVGGTIDVACDRKLEHAGRARHGLRALVGVGAHSGQCRPNVRRRLRRQRGVVGIDSGLSGVPAREAAHGPRRQLSRRRRAAMITSDGPHLGIDVCRFRGQRLGRANRLVAAAVNAKKPLLQLVIGCQFRRAHLARDTAVDHHGDTISDVHGHADVLLDQQHRDAAVTVAVGAVRQLP